MIHLEFEIHVYKQPINLLLYIYILYICYIARHSVKGIMFQQNYFSHDHQLKAIKIRMNYKQQCLLL